jgi:hypothetical protein
MKPCILSLRISRRAIGLAVLDAETLTVSDARHLPSVRERATAAATRYVDRVVTPGLTSVIVDSPGPGGSETTDAVVDVVVDLLRAKGLSVLTIVKGDVLAAYGVSALHSRGDVRELVRSYWPVLERVRGPVKPYAIDAAAAALYGECRVTLSPHAP